MKSLMIMAAAATIGVFAADAAQAAMECTTFDQLVMTNQIDRMNQPSQFNAKCVANQEMMKALSNLRMGNTDRCLVHMQNARDAINGHPPADLQPVASCKAPY